MPFEESVNFALKSLNFDFGMKDKQLETLRSLFMEHDCVSVLPTGYGKSAIFQCLPWMFQYKRRLQHPSITIVVSPLTSLMQDQVMSLCEKGIKACFLNCEETLLNNKIISFILRSKLYQQRVCAVVIDEVHMVSEWGNSFRVAFKKLSELVCIFPSPNAVHLAMTATATPSALKELIDDLQFTNVCVITVNPDRPNITIEVQTRLPNSRKYDKLDELLQPLSTKIAISE